MKKYKVKEDFISDIECFMCLDLKRMNKKGLTKEEWVDDYHIREDYLIEIVNTELEIKTLLEESGTICSCGNNKGNLITTVYPLPDICGYCKHAIIKTDSQTIKMRKTKT